MDAFLEVLGKWGLSILIIAVLAYGLTALIKIPVKKLAVKMYGEEGKKKLTKYIVFIPVVLAFIGSLVDTWIRSGAFEAPFVEGFDWIRVGMETMATMALPALIVSIKENFQESHDAELLKSLTEGSDEQKAIERQKAIEIAKANAEANKDAKAKAKAEKEALALEKERARLEAKRKAELAKMDKEREAFEAKYNALKNSTTEVINSSEVRVVAQNEENQMKTI